MQNYVIYVTLYIPNVELQRELVITNDNRLNDEAWITKTNKQTNKQKQKQNKQTNTEKGDRIPQHYWIYTVAYESIKEKEIVEKRK